MAQVRDGAVEKLSVLYERHRTRPSTSFFTSTRILFSSRGLTAFIGGENL